MALSLLMLGFLVGMRHATEADHLAAMATIASRGNKMRSTALQGAAWGIGPYHHSSAVWWRSLVARQHDS